MKNLTPEWVLLRFMFAVATANAPATGDGYSSLDSNYGLGVAVGGPGVVLSAEPVRPRYGLV